MSSISGQSEGKRERRARVVLLREVREEKGSFSQPWGWG